MTDYKNTSDLIQQKIKEGKAKIGKCDISTCNNEELLYKMTDGFICWECMNKLIKILNLVDKQ